MTQRTRRGGSHWIAVLLLFALAHVSFAASRHAHPLGGSSAPAVQAADPSDRSNGGAPARDACPICNLLAHSSALVGARPAAFDPPAVPSPRVPTPPARQRSQAWAATASRAPPVSLV